MTILAFPDVCKAPTDVETILLDWSAFAPTGQTEFTSHAVAVTSGGVAATDAGAEGLVQQVRITGGTCGSHSVISATVTFGDGTTLTRGFDVIVR